MAFYVRGRGETLSLSRLADITELLEEFGKVTVIPMESIVDCIFLARYEDENKAKDAYEAIGEMNRLETFYDMKKHNEIIISGWDNYTPEDIKAFVNSIGKTACVKYAFHVIYDDEIDAETAVMVLNANSTPDNPVKVTFK